MYGRLRVDVREGIREVVFVDLLRRNGPSDNLAEDAIHAVRITETLKPQFFDSIRIEIAVSQPFRADQKICDPGPRLSLTSIGPRREVDVLRSMQFIAQRFPGLALVLDRSFALPAEDNRDARIALEISIFARRRQGVEDDFKIRGNWKSNERRLRLAARADAGNHSQLAGAHEVVDRFVCHISGHFKSLIWRHPLKLRVRV